MKKCAFKRSGQPMRLHQKILLTMKLTTLLCIITLVQVSARGLAQRITLKENNSPIEKVLSSITAQSGYNFIYNDQDLKGKKVTIEVTQRDILTVIHQIMKGSGLEYTITQKNIAITTKPERSLIEKVIDRIMAIDIVGTVLDENQRPLSGASVKLKSSGRGVITDLSGSFKILNVIPGDWVVISYLGYKTAELPVKPQIGAISLQIADSKLDEIQIVAYGQTNQRLGTGNVTTVSAKDIEKSPVSNPLLALQGRVSGISILPASGNALANLTVRIQGTNSMKRGNDPFYVVDGVPYPSEYINASALPGVNNGGSATMNFINPDNIESISILKDADATAIYGSRAANGAILITTKKGKAGEMKVNLNIRQGYSQQPKFLELMNTAQYLEMRKEAIKNDGGSIGPGDYDVNGFWDNNANDHNWQKELSGRNAIHSNYNLNFSGGNNNTTYLIGATFRRNGSIYSDELSDRTGALHFNLNTRSANQRFELQFNGNYVKNMTTLPYSEMATYALLLPPNAPPGLNTDGSVNWAADASGSSTFSLNPYALMLRENKNTTTNLVGSMLLRYQIAKGLNFKSNFGYNEMVANGIIKDPMTASIPELRPYLLNTSVFSEGRQKSWIVEPQLSYQWAGKVGNINGLLGASVQQRGDHAVQYVASGFSSIASMENLSSATQLETQFSGISDYKYMGVFAQLNYNYKDKYLLNLSGRRDGSSRFGAGNKYHNFAAIGLGWTFSEESFFKPLSWLSFGKLRLSYGTTGSDQIGDYNYLSLYNPINVGVPYGGQSSLGTTRTANPQLQWEQTTKTNIGLDLGFFADRLILSANYFYNRSGNQLLNLLLPTFMGGAGVIRNLPAVVQNTGLELTLASRNFSAPNFKWNTNFNLYIPKNKLVRFDNLNDSPYATSFILGQSLDFKRLYEFAGVNPQTGAYQFKAADGKLTETPETVTDQQKIVTLGQRLSAGLENTFSYKGFSLSFLLRHVRQTGPNLGASPFGFPPGFPGINAPSAVLDRWQSPGQHTAYARFNSNGSLSANLATYYQSSDATVNNASFFRFENATFAYNLPESALKKIRIANARIYFEGQNLFWFGPYKGLDPETMSALTTPILRTLTLGLQIGF